MTVFIASVCACASLPPRVNLFRSANVQEAVGLFACLLMLLLAPVDGVATRALPAERAQQVQLACSAVVVVCVLWNALSMLAAVVLWAQQSFRGPRCARRRSQAQVRDT